MIFALFLSCSLLAAVPSLESLPETELAEWMKTEAIEQQNLNEAIEAAYKAFTTESFEIVKKSNVPELEIKKLKAAKEKFLEALVLIGTGNDFQRFNAFYDYRREFFRIAKQHKIELPEEFKKMKIEKSLKLSKAIPQSLVSFLRFIWATFVSGVIKSDTTPTTVAADRFFAEQGKHAGVDVDFKGKLELSQSSKTVNLVVLNHVDALYDAVTISAFKLDSYLTFGALNLKGEGIFSVASNNLFSPIMKLLVKNKDVLLLGQGNADPLQRMIRSINEGRSNTVVLFPQGMIATGFDETLPIKNGFSDKVIKSLQDAGYKVNLQVVTSVNRFEQPVEKKLGQRKKISAVIDPVLNDADIRRAMQAGGGKVLDLWIRRTWIERISEYSPGYQGVKKDFVTGSRQCQAFYSK